MIKKTYRKDLAKACWWSCSYQSWCCNRNRNEGKKLRIEDALAATRAAVEEGIVPGGGTAYVNVIQAVKAYLDKTEGDEKTGVKIIIESIRRTSKTNS